MNYAYLLFCTIFLGQIFFISWYFPSKILGRVQFIFDNYPPTEYPKLYPKPVEYYKLGHWLLRLAFRLVFAAGFVVLAGVVLLDPLDDGSISEAWPAAYGALQFVPLMLLEIVSFSQYRQMRQSSTAHRRKASLERRRLLDFVSPWLLAVAVLLLMGVQLFEYWLRQDDFRWSQALVILATNLFLVTVGAWHLYGKKVDPHQSTADRARQVKAQLHSLVYVSIAMSLYFMFMAADQVYDIDILDAPLLSLYFQIIAFLSIGYLLRTQRLEDLDLEVYRDEPATAAG